MGDLTVVRWTRFGKDRLYIKHADGGDVACVDVVTSTVTCQRPELMAAVVALAHEHGVTVRADEHEPPIHPSPQDQEAAVQTVDVDGWQDLASNRPGQAAREQAAASLAAMKEKSRIGTWLARAVDAKTDERAWRVGADGEETIGRRLEKLREHGWHVLHSVPVGSRGSDIDHVLIGPGGVYTINTKKHPDKKVWVGGDTIMISGRRVPYVRNSEFEADRAERLLSHAVGFPVPVRPVLIFTTGTLFPDVTIKEKPRRVIVLDRMDVPRDFRRADVRLTTGEIESIYDHARRSTTWTG